jgi:hypothetical protein
LLTNARHYRRRAWWPPDKVAVPSGRAALQRRSAAPMVAQLAPTNILAPPRAILLRRAALSFQLDPDRRRPGTPPAAPGGRWPGHPPRSSISVPFSYLAPENPYAALHKIQLDWLGRLRGYFPRIPPGTARRTFFALVKRRRKNAAPPFRRFSRRGIRGKKARVFRRRIWPHPLFDRRFQNQNYGGVFAHN